MIQLSSDGVVLEIYLDHKFQWLQEGLNCEPLAYEVLPNVRMSYEVVTKNLPSSYELITK